MSLNVGIVGVGQIATNMHIPVLRAMPDVRLAWLADLNPTRAAQVAAIHQTSAAPLESLPAADIVLIATPLPGRDAILSRYADSNTGFLIEKPLANDVAEHARLAEAFAPWRISVGFQRRFYATSQLLKDFLDRGVFGPLRSILIAEGGRIMRSGGGGDYQVAPASAGGGIVKNLGCHSLDLICWLTGASDFAVERAVIIADRESDLACTANFRLAGGVADGCTVNWDMSWLAGRSNRMEFIFDHLRLSAAVSPDAKIQLHARSGEVLAEIPVDERKGALTSAQAFHLEWAAALEAARTRQESVLSPARTLLGARLTDAILTKGTA